MRNKDKKLCNASPNFNSLFPSVVTNYAVPVRISRRQFQYFGQDHVIQYESCNNQTKWFLWLRCKFITGCQRARDVVRRKRQPEVLKPTVPQYIEVSKHTEVMVCHALVVTYL
jgi:hypothetical protein